MPEAPCGPATSEPYPVLLTRVDLARNMRRFHRPTLVRSPFGEAGVPRTWARIKTSAQCRTDRYAGHEEPEAALQGLLRAKRRRGHAS